MGARPYPTGGNLKIAYLHLGEPGFSHTGLPPPFGVARNRPALR